MLKNNQWLWQRSDWRVCGACWCSVRQLAQERVKEGVSSPHASSFCWFVQTPV